MCLPTHIFFDKFRHIGIFETFFESDVPIIDKLQEIMFYDLHPFTARCLHDRWNLMQFVFSDQMGDRRIFYEYLFGEFQSASITLFQETLGKHRYERIGKLETNLILLS